MHCVVGSGPSGVACARALLDQGLAVRMLDAGITLEADRADFVARLASSAPAGWSRDLVAFLKSGMASGTKGIPLKLLYGSDFPYRDVETHVPATYGGVALRPSLAKGGLSNVWGAAVMPYIDADLGGWPFGAAELAAHYAAALRLTGLSGRVDDLADKFPLYADQPDALELSRQSSTLLASLERNKAALNRQGINFGASRVALRAAAKDQPGCVYCGMCMYGCPYGFIYNSTDTLKELLKHPDFTYQPNVVVRTLDESADAVAIHAVDRLSGRPQIITAERVFLAAGVIATTKILLESRGLFDQPVWMKDSQYFLVPLALPRRTRDVRSEKLHTLSQLFIEIDDAATSPNTVHLQIYSYNDLISGALSQTLGKLGLNRDSILRQFEERLMVIQGYLHSDHSSRIRVELKRNGSGGARLELGAEINPRTKNAVGRVVSKLMRNARNLGALPLRPLLQISEPGRGFHTGGTFPMRRHPAAFESDTLGRPHGWSRTHCVDATVLPTIPATTITLSVMANAHRIGTDAARLDKFQPSESAIARPPTCLITGSRGYLGGCVKSRFEQAGWKVIELIRNPNEEEIRSGQAVAFRLGGSVAAEKLAGADALVHCAYDFTGRNWEDIRRVNVLGSLNLFAAAERAGVKRKVFISTMSAFTGCKSLYGRAKLEIESALPPETLILRPGLIHGDSPRGMFGNLVAQVKKSGRIPVFGGGSQVLYLSHQADLCGVVFDFAAGRTAAVGGPVIAAHDQGWTFKQLLQEIAKSQRKEVSFLSLPWRPVWLGIKTFELCRIPLSFRSDSLVSLMNQDLHPSFAATQKAGFKFRPFDAGKLKL